MAEFFLEFLGQYGISEPPSTKKRNIMRISMTFFFASQTAAKGRKNTMEKGSTVKRTNDPFFKEPCPKGKGSSSNHYFSGDIR